MISENKTLICPGSSVNSAMAGNNNFAYLKAYATYLLENKLNELAGTQLTLSREINLPVLKHVEQISNDQLISIHLAVAKELLNCCTSNEPFASIRESVKKWLHSEPSPIDSQTIIVEDITLIAFTMRQALQQLAPAYSNEFPVLLKLITEIDLFITQAETIFLKTYLHSKNKKPKDNQAGKSPELTLELATLTEKFRAQELRYQRMISEVEDYAILLMNEDGIIQNWNKGAEKIKGYKASEIIGKNFRLFYRKEDQDKKLPETLIQLATEKGKASHEGWRLRKDGTMFWGSIVITALHDENNKLIGFTKVTRDLTEKKIADDTLKEYASRIEKHNEELIRINKDLDAFTYMASHDLQEPLRKIKTFCNFIIDKSKDDLSQDVLGYFNRIEASTTRMQTLIDSLLNYSRAATNEIVLTATDLNVIIEDVKKELADAIKDKNVIITSDELPKLKIQPLQFYQLFLNLIENAIKYSRPDVVTQINITASKFLENTEEGIQEFYRIEVADNGIGFEQKYEGNIFKLFQRLHGRNEYSGTGIGLAICKKIAENHNGTISATGEPGKGATFTITLPVTD
jgi:PAS domain S-box-containing protein